MIAESTCTRRLATAGTHRRLALDLSLPHIRCFTGIIDVPPHSLRSCLGDIDLLPRRAIRAQTLIFIHTRDTDISVASVATMKVLLHLILSLLKRGLMRLVPLRCLTFETIGKDSAAAFSRPTQVPYSTADE